MCTKVLFDAKALDFKIGGDVRREQTRDANEE